MSDVSNTTVYQWAMICCRRDHIPAKHRKYLKKMVSVAAAEVESWNDAVDAYPVALRYALELYVDTAAQLVMLDTMIGSLLQDTRKPVAGDEAAKVTIHDWTRFVLWAGRDNIPADLRGKIQKAFDHTVAKVKGWNDAVDAYPKALRDALELYVDTLPRLRSLEKLIDSLLRDTRKPMASDGTAKAL